MGLCNLPGHRRSVPSRTIRGAITGFALGLALVCAHDSSAQALTLVTNRAGIVATDFVDWTSLGGSTNVSNPFSINSNLGSPVDVSKSQATSFENREETVTWVGNFSANAQLLYTGDGNNQLLPDPITLSFSGGGIFAGGAQIQSNTFGIFTARIEAFDASNTSLGFFNLVGDNTGAADDSAIFIGVSNDTAIAKISLSLVTAPLDTIGSFAINRFSYSTVPVPGPLPILGAAAAFGASRKLKRRIKLARQH